MVVNNNNIGAGGAQVTPRGYITIGARLIKSANRRLFEFLPIYHQSAQSASSTCGVIIGEPRCALNVMKCLQSSMRNSFFSFVINELYRN